MKDFSSDISASFSKNPISDDLILVKDEKAIKQHIDMLLLSDVFASIGRPFVCAGLKRYIQESATNSTLGEIRDRVRESMKFEPRVSITSLDVSFDQTSKFVQIKMELQIISTKRAFVYETRLRRVL